MANNSYHCSDDVLVLQSRLQEWISFAKTSVRKFPTFLICLKIARHFKLGKIHCVRCATPSNLHLMIWTNSNQAFPILKFLWIFSFKERIYRNFYVFVGFWGITDGLQNLSHKISQSRGHPCSGHNICDTPAVNLVPTEWLVCPKFVNLTKYFNFYAEIRRRKDKLMQKECRRISTWRMVWLQRWLSRCSCNEGGHFDPCLAPPLFMILFLISEFS